MVALPSGPLAGSQTPDFAADVGQAPARLPGRLATGLSRFPERGSHPKELVSLGIKEYRQTVFKPYRVIYRVADTKVIIYLIVDGRRDMQAVLARRLLGS